MTLGTINDNLDFGLRALFLSCLVQSPQFPSVLTSLSFNSGHEFYYSFSLEPSDAVLFENLRLLQWNHMQYHVLNIIMVEAYLSPPILTDRYNYPE